MERKKVKTFREKQALIRDGWKMAEYGNSHRGYVLERDENHPKAKEPTKVKRKFFEEGDTLFFEVTNVRDESEKLCG